MPQISNEPFLKELYAVWQTQPDRTHVYDGRTGQNHTIEQLLRDIARTRDDILDQCSDSIKARLKDSSADDVFMTLLAAPGYGFVVAFLAVFSIGAVSTILAPTVLPEEAEYFQSLSSSILLIASERLADTAQQIANSTAVPLYILNQQPHTTQDEPLTLSTNPPLKPQKGAALLVTSGTTGPPKGVLLSRYTVVFHAETLREQRKLTPNDVCPITAPVHYVMGLHTTGACLYSGMVLEFPGAAITPDWFWKRIAVGDVTFSFTGLPLFQRLLTDYKRVRRTWTETEAEAVLAGLRKLRTYNVGGGIVTSEAKALWASLTGRQLDLIYGTTELGPISLTKSNAFDEGEAIPYGCVGTVAPGIEAKLSAEGEILLKSGALFLRYLSPDPNKTKEAFTPDGWFRTGDLGRIDGENLYVLGRASTDIIRFLGWKIFGPEVEDALLSLDLFSLAIVVAMPDATASQRVAALVSFRDSIGHQQLDLAAIRKLLAEKQGVNAYKLPTVLRVLKNGEVVPRTASGKVVKRRIVEEFFGPEKLQGREVEVWDLERKEEGIGRRAFDWAGI